MTASDRSSSGRTSTGTWDAPSVSTGKDDGEIHDTVELYEAGKAELIDWLLDEGTTLGALGDGQYVTICARMNDEDLKHEKKIERLTLRAKIDDLKAYADDKLSETEMKARIVIEES